ncbi:MAG: DUF4492 domain-containing protein [Muribaculaceae bacterium]|jgi:hypothetical protein|nr:DUF4492 domain-containing protein [Muribaculaceae bacterium]CCX49001.1 putative uncharacterized protein [Bacteroides sp. CAG:927]
MNLKNSIPARIARFYIEGFRSMTVGRKLWALIIIKVALLMLVFKLFFFPDLLQERYSTDAQRAQAVRTSLTAR